MPIPQPEPRGYPGNLGLLFSVHAQSDRTASLGDRLDRLEADVRRTQELLRAVIERLEKQTGTDLDGDGRIGQ